MCSSWRCRSDVRHDSIEVQTYEKNEKFFLQVVNDCREAVRFKDGIPVTRTDRATAPA